MKELSIEEKAKAYDKVREKIAVRFGTDVAEGIFSEFEESEDERIRKALIKYFKNFDSESLYIECLNEENIIDWLEKQGEQKPTIEMKSAEESLGIDSETYNKIVDECIYGEQKSQRMISAEAKEAMYAKTAWSEEDEKMLADACIMLDWYKGNNWWKAQYIKDWLKSIKGRVQPKKEWSEEDDYMLESIISDFAAGHKSSIGQDKWLKSLKTRYTWKPSDEQMNALDSTLQYSQVSHNSFEHLNSLFNDLKKLK